MAEIVMIIWFVMIGGAVGSFLNVVVYRLPNKMSLVKPGSHCPKCSHPIRWYDNVPVFGWGFLGGKCRDCKAPISFRYPFVEGLCAIMFALVAALIFIPGNASPFEKPTMIWQFAADFDIQKELLLSLFMVAPLTVILTVGMVEFDEAQITRLIFIPVAVVFFICFAVMFPFEKETVAARSFFAYGLASGVLLALILFFVVPKKKWDNFSLGLIATGCTFGMWGTIYATAVAIVIYIATRFVSGKSVPTLSLLISLLGMMTVFLMLK